MPRIFQREPENHQPGQHKRRADRDGHQSVLRLELAFVATFGEESRNGVVQPVANNLTKAAKSQRKLVVARSFHLHCGNDGREIEVSDLRRAEVIQWRDEDSERCVDAHHPSKGEKIVDGGQEDRRLQDDSDGSHYRLLEGAAEMACTVLLRSNQPCDLAAKASGTTWLLLNRQFSIVESLFCKQYLRDEAKSSHAGVDSESDLPFLRRDNEGGDKRAEVRRQDDEGGPDVRLARAFVEEEQVFDEHESPALSHSGEEAVQDTEGHEC